MGKPAVALLLPDGHFEGLLARGAIGEDALRVPGFDAAFAIDGADADMVGAALGLDPEVFPEDPG
jgi:hypothetical protein